MNLPIKELPVEFLALSKGGASDDPLPLGSFSIPWRAFHDESDKDKSKSQRLSLTGKWCKITPIGKGQSIFRIIRFSSHGERDGNWKMSVDYDGWLALGNRSIEEKPNPKVVSISQCSGFNLLFSVFHHPDPLHKTAARLGVLSLVLGIISVILAILAYL